MIVESTGYSPAQMTANQNSVIHNLDLIVSAQESEFWKCVFLHVAMTVSFVGFWHHSVWLLDIITFLQDPGATTISIEGTDQPELLSQLTAAFNSLDLIVLSANINSANNGQVKGTFTITDQRNRKVLLLDTSRSRHSTMWNLCEVLHVVLQCREKLTMEWCHRFLHLIPQSLA